MNKDEREEFGMFKQKVDDINSKLDTHIVEQREDFNKLFVKIDNLKDDFASKWVEKLTLTVAITVFVTIIGGIIKFIMR